MSRSSKKFDFKALEEKWYRALEKSGFRDIEDHTREDRPLKRWTGISYEFGVIQQRHSGFPDPVFNQEEEFLHHPEFEDICRRICKHGNHSLTHVKVREVWVNYVSGESERSIAALLKVNDSAVHRVIRMLTEWMQFMDNDTPQVPERISRVVVRSFEKEDEPCIYSTWRNSLWFDVKRDEKLADKFYRVATAAIKAILKDTLSSVRVACLDDDPTLIVGYAVFNNKTLEWIYVKSDYRKRKIASLLASGFFSTISEPMTKIGRSIQAKHDFKIRTEDESQTEISSHR